jgi:hypothetical protein
MDFCTARVSTSANVLFLASGFQHQVGVFSRFLVRNYVSEGLLARILLCGICLDMMPAIGPGLCGVGAGAKLNLLQHFAAIAERRLKKSVRRRVDGTRTKECEE